MSGVVDKHSPAARTALVLSGGGMSAAFSAGVLQGLGKLGLTRFDVAAGVSASAPTLAYFAAGQLDAIGRIWTEYVPSAEVVRSRPPRRSPAEENSILFDTDHLVDVILRARVPLNVAALARGPLSCRFVAGRIVTWRSVELEAFDERSSVIWQALKACMALPGLARWPVTVDGRRYVDAGIYDPVPISLDGQPLAQRTLVVLNSPRVPSALFASRLSRRLLASLVECPAEFAKAKAGLAARHASSHKRLREAEAYGEALVIAPDRPTPAPLATTNRSKIERTLAMGRETVTRMENSIRRHLCGRSTAAIPARTHSQAASECTLADPPIGVKAGGKTSLEQVAFA